MGESSHDIIQALLEQKRMLLERIAALEAEVLRLKLELAAAKKNSRNSSKPPSCGELHPTPVADQVRQQIDLRPDPLIRREYRAPAYRCDSCGTFQRAKLPEYAARSGFVGDGLAATLVFLNAKGHASHSTLAVFHIDKTRAAGVLEHILGPGYQGTYGRWSSTARPAKESEVRTAVHTKNACGPS